MPIQWPLQNATTGKPRTTPTNQHIWKAAMEPARAEYPEAVQEWCTRMEACRNWRSDYVDLIHEFVDIQTQCTPATIHAMCRAGLETAQQVFQLDNDTTENKEGSLSVEQAFLNALTQQSSSQEIPSITKTGGNTDQLTSSSSSSYAFPLASPHGTDQDPLWMTGDQAVTQCRAWETYGCMEPSATTDAATVLQAPEGADTFVQDKVFCLLGVTSEMGPTKHLLKIPGAHVLGIARAGRKTRDLLKWFASEGHPTATLTLMEEGADMLNEGPKIAQWLIQELSQQARTNIVLMPLAYMDGEANVRVTVVMDAIVTHVIRAIDKQGMTGHLAYLTSPTTCYTIPPEAAQNAQYRYEHERGLVTNMIHFMSLGNILAPSNEWEQLNEGAASSDDTKTATAVTGVLHNGLVPLQGPNYALAKTMQQWRCMLHAAKGKGRVSAPMAPGSRTQSVVHSPEASAALEGVQFLPPMISFDSVPCSSLMTAIVLAQLSKDDDDPSKNIAATTTSPFQLFWRGAVHGGGWRCPYNLQTCYAMAYILGRTVAKQGWCPEGALAKLEE